MIEAFDITSAEPTQLIMLCVVAFMVSIFSGLSGYGAGLVIPVFMAPVVGVANVIPVMAVAMVFNGIGRTTAFRHDINWHHVRQILLFGLPACIVGAWCYTLLSSRWVALLLGSFLLLSIPLRRILNHLQYRLQHGGEQTAGIVFGFINGGMAGTGIILISILMSAGLGGAALIATDAMIAFILSITKIILFSSMAVLDQDLGIAGILIGLCTAPGGFIARRLLNYIPISIHAWVMEVVVLFGGSVFLWQGLR